jgi:hypothetical protein
MTTDSAVRIVYLPANAAYVVLWHDQRLAGPMPKVEAEAFVRWMSSVSGVLS